MGGDCSIGRVLLLDAHEGEAGGSGGGEQCQCASQQQELEHFGNPPSLSGEDVALDCWLGAVTMVTAGAG